MAGVTSEAIILCVLLLVNGLLAMSEIALVSANKIRLEQRSDRGDRRALQALRLANNPNQVLSTVQIGITLIGLFAGAFSGATVAETLRAEAVCHKSPLSQAQSQAIALGLVVLVMTYFWLVVGELVPKRLALARPEAIATRVAMPLSALSALFAPIVYLLSTSNDLILSFLGEANLAAEPYAAEEEIKVLLKQGTEAGTFEVAEQDMVERVLQLDERPVNTLMTLRPEIVWLDLEDSVESNRNKVIHSSHTRFPVCQSSLDNVLGVVQVTSLLSSLLQGRPFDLTAALRQPLFVPEAAPALKVLEMLKQTHTNIALVVDEYGIIQGLITLNDLMEAIVGDLPSVNQQCDLQVVQREDGSWLLDGIMGIDDFKKLFEITELPGEQRGNYHTLGGFVVAQLGRIPGAADSFEWQGLRFEVMDMDGNRVDKVLIVPK
ncbi:MAG: HlyC/CorC family transporter [Spirulinaceae cyanobacterium RM2_2_10]|nr:HlyC/CorC family transporter [Spirulinaceae cyanobacterium RM2_2_10]